MLPAIGAVLLRLAPGFEREEGQTLAEYGLILALVTVAAVVALSALGVAVSGQMDAIVAAFS